jgi:hypothetical protein
LRNKGMNNNNPKGNRMAKRYEVRLTADQVFLLQTALGGQVIKDAKGTAQELARVLNPIARQIVAEYEENVVQEFVTNMDQEISKILE